MAYLDNSTVTVDAILTKKGRENLARSGQLNITKFALADDEVDYDLYNPTHTLGSNYYGSVIENMPVLEAIPDESQMMRYKLVTLPKGSTNIPQIQIVPSGVITLTSRNQSATLTPTTTNNAAANSQLGYTATISDITVADIVVSEGAEVTTQGTTPSFVGEGNLPLSKTVVGKKFNIIAKTNSTSANKSARVTIFGNETGGYDTVTIVVQPTVIETLQVQNISTNPTIDLSQLGQ